MSEKTVVVLGASANPSKYGYKSVVAHREQGYTVYPVNPNGGEIAGLTVYRTLADVPLERADRITVYLPPAIGMEMLEEISALPCSELFFNPGSESEALIEKARELGLEPIQACSIINLRS